MCFSWKLWICKRDLGVLSTKGNVWAWFLDPDADRPVIKKRFCGQLGKFKHGLRARWCYENIVNFLMCDDGIVVMFLRKPSLLETHTAVFMGRMIWCLGFALNFSVLFPRSRERKCNKNVKPLMLGDKYMGFIILFSLLLCVFEHFHNDNKNLHPVLSPSV